MKAVFVVDIPDFDGNIGNYIMAYKLWKITEDSGDWHVVSERSKANLKLLPKKYTHHISEYGSEDLNGAEVNVYYVNGRHCGYNQCIDEILGENNG